MFVKVGMEMAEVLAVRTDLQFVSVEEWEGETWEEWEGVAEDGALLCVEVTDGVVTDVCKGAWV